ncbi:MAG: histidine phosphatase family protein [Anaerolineae bacterium]|nr:histidine phosphatase family protein [Anaerolineae bacterium]
MGRIVLVRHGEALHHVTGYVGGWSDVGLTARGRAQADAAAARLAGGSGEGGCVVACSDLARAVESAAPIAAALGVAARPLAALRSSYMGVVQGLSLAEARQHRIPPTEPLIDWASYPEAETWRQVYGRVTACLAGLLAEGPERLVVVSHKTPLHLALCWWLGLDLDQLTRVWFDLDPGSVTTLRTEPWGGHTVLGVNDTAHLDRGCGA